MSMSVCTLTLHPPSVEGGTEPRPTADVLSFSVFCLPVSSKYPCIPEPEFGNACVCTDPPPPTCMYEGLPPHTHKWRGGVCTPTHSQIQESGTQEYFLCLI